MRRTAFAVLLFAGTAISVQAQATPADAALDRAVAAYRKVRTVRASFEQTLDNPVTGRSSTAHGELLVKRPGRISVKFTDPVGDRIVADGKRVWVYLPSSAPGQVMRAKGGAEGMGLDASTELLERAREKFVVTDGGAATVAGRPTRVVMLQPRTERAYSRARIWVDDRDGLVRQLELTEASGLVRKVALSAMKLNTTIPGSAFNFEVPKGVKVYDGGA